jgi:hypothetical protein
MEERRRYELYVALEGFLDADCAEYLMALLQEIEQTPDWQEWNRARIDRDPGMAHRIYAKFHRGVGPDAAATFFELFDPIGLRRAGAPAVGETHDRVAETENGVNHGHQ